MKVDTSHSQYHVLHNNTVMIYDSRNMFYTKPNGTLSTN